MPVLIGVRNLIKENRNVFFSGTDKCFRASIMRKDYIMTIWKESQACLDRSVLNTLKC